MWGCISTDYIYQSNFNTGFSSMKSDVLIHLTQWQYWWWFWFSFLWVLYYLFINRVVRTKVLKMRPKIATSYRAHGKWGDFVACIIPSIWCINILTNSNFILRLIEWQNESTLFTVRIRGRQWYWVYKFELKQLIDIFVTPKNIGNNNWVINVNGVNHVSSDYHYALSLRSNNTWLKKYWADHFNSALNKNNLLFNSEDYKLKSNVRTILSKKNLMVNKLTTGNFIYLTDYYWQNNYNLNNKKLNFFINKNFINKKFFEFNTLDVNTTNFFLKTFLLKKIKKFINITNKFVDFNDNSRFLKKRVEIFEPITFRKTFFNLNVENIVKVPEDITLISVEFNKKRTIEQKVASNQNFFVLKQKRYKRKKHIPLRTKAYKDDLGSKLTKLKFSDKPFLISNSFFDNFDFEPTKLYNLMRKNKNRPELISVQLSRRLLRTKKTLVLPAHVNIALITNSYDVVHSWFIPGLGIKLDCVPGRSTHHTFFCDSVGFYYGQCAEICGRYHHHMPIRLCVLPFEHFLIWWHHFGLPKVLFTYNKTKLEAGYSFKKFSW